MSIYATWLSIDDDNHLETCARWVEVSKEDRMQLTCMYMDDGRVFAPTNEACTCTEKAPLIYQGSHINPDKDHPRGGSVGVAAIPNHCHPDVRGTHQDEGPPVEYLRLDVAEHSTTYHGMNPGYATVVLDRKQVEELRDTLTQWLETEQRY